MSMLWPVEGPSSLGLTNARPTNARRDGLQAIIDAMHEGVVVLAPSKIILHINVVVARLFGLRADDVVGAPFSTLVEIGDDLDFLTPREAMGRRTDGTFFPMEVSCTRMDLAGELVVVTVRDLTERKRADAERTRLGEQFFQAQRMETVGVMAGWVAHDIGNILNAMLACAEFVRDRVPAGDPAERVLDSAISAGLRGRDVVGQLLAFGRCEEDAVGAVSLAQIVRDAAALLPFSEERGLRLTVEEAPGLPAVRGAAVKLYQVVVNLFVNAVQAAGPGGGELRVGLESVALDRGLDGSGGVQVDGGCCRLSLGRVQPGHYVRLRVTDNGIGMTAETLARIFEPFFSTKHSSGQCSGLGLAAVFGIVSNQGGAISVRTCPGDGATFDVLLPAAVE